MKAEINDLLIDKTATLIKALQKMDNLGRKLLIVTDKGKYISLLSIGDIQRSIIKNNDLNLEISNVLRSQVKVAHEEDDPEMIKEQIRKRRNEFMPVLSKTDEIVDIIFWEDIVDENDTIILPQFKLPVVIMAGGLGTRLKPLTSILPKPLIPINDETLIEGIFKRFYNHGCDTFYISVNYKAELLEFYLDQLNLPYKLHYFKEHEPLGTAGSLSLLKGIINETFFVSNCDILIDQDYNEVLKYHQENNNEITVIAALKHFPIAYGTIETGDNGKLIQLNEKPELTFRINSGMYILEPHILDMIPVNKFLHITQVIDSVLNRGGKVGVFPVSEKSWTDIGTWDEYRKIYV